MKRLLILRHAKSSWALPGVKDHDRPLNERGTGQTQLLASWFLNYASKPDVVLCSTSARTVETCDGIKSGLSGASVETIKQLYEGSVDDYLAILFAQTAETLLLIGHNPTCDELTRYLVKPSSPAFEKMMAHHFGTANLAVMEFGGNDWCDLGEASCTLTDFVRPADLA